MPDGSNQGRFKIVTNSRRQWCVIETGKTAPGGKHNTGHDGLELIRDSKEPAYMYFHSVWQKEQRSWDTDPVRLRWDTWCMSDLVLAVEIRNGEWMDWQANGQSVTCLCLCMRAYVYVCPSDHQLSVVAFFRTNDYSAYRIVNRNFCLKHWAPFEQLTHMQIKRTNN